MKAILISIRPEFVAKILNGEKTIEIRKTAPKCDFPIDVYIYCTKKHKNQSLIKHAFDGKYRVGNCVGSNDNEPLNGKVVAKFTLNKVDWFCSEEFSGSYEKGVISFSNTFKLFNSKDSCMSQQEIYEYTKFEPAFGWHITNLEIFDKPKELSDLGLKRAPQSWQYVEVEE